MTTSAFISHGQNAEDVVLWRALGHLTTGRYVEVGANDPSVDSITRSFYDHGWSGLEVEPVASFVERFRAARPRDVVVRAAVTADQVEAVNLHIIDDTGLSTTVDAVRDRHAHDGWVSHTEAVPARRLDALVTEHGFATGEVQFCVIDVEGAERSVLESVDLRAWRPWILVIEATSPRTQLPTHHEWEHLVTGAGYEFVLFDGLSRFYVAQEHAAVLREPLSRPANVLDGYRHARDDEATRAYEQCRAQIVALEHERDALTDDLIRWRGRALEHWASDLAGSTPGSYLGSGGGSEIARLQAELEATRQTLSWRVTKPLRAVRRRQLRTGR